MLDVLDEHLALIQSMIIRHLSTSPTVGCCATLQVMQKVREGSNRFGASSFTPRKLLMMKLSVLLDVGALRFGARGFTGLWPSNFQTWHLGQIFGSLLKWGTTTRWRKGLSQTSRWSELRPRRRDAHLPDETRGVWSELQGSKTLNSPAMVIKMLGSNIRSIGDGSPLAGFQEPQKPVPFLPGT